MGELQYNSGKYSNTALLTLFYTTDSLIHFTSKIDAWAFDTGRSLILEKFLHNEYVHIKYHNPTIKFILSKTGLPYVVNQTISTHFTTFSQEHFLI